MAKKIVQTIRELIDRNDPRRNIGRVRDVKSSSFKFSRQNLKIPEEKRPKKQVVSKNNILWRKSYYEHNKGQYHNLSLYDFNTSLIVEKDVINSDNGNFKDRLIKGNSNAKYSCRVGVDAAVTVDLKVIAKRSSIAVFATDESNKTTTEVFTSEGTNFYNESIIPINLSSAGNWTITILYYRQEAGGEISVSGDLGSYVHALQGPQKLPKIIPTINTSFAATGIESKFLDGANGPALANILYFDRVDPDQSSFGGQELIGYGMYEVIQDQLSYTVTSGWGTDGFVVAGDRRADFPIAGSYTIDSTEYTVSGSAYISENNQTLVVASGTAFGGSAADPIFIDRDRHIVDILNKPSTNQIMSGIHQNVVAGHTYTYQVDTYNDIGERGDRTNKLSIAAGDFTWPGPVTGLGASGTLKGIEITWDNPSDPDLKGIHIWDRDNIISGVNLPVATILKGSNTTLPNNYLVTHTGTGPLFDNTEYTFYLSTFDWAGNEAAQNMPNITATTAFEIKTSQAGQRIVTDSDTNQLRFYDGNGNLIIRIGEDVLQSIDGVEVTDGVVYIMSGTGFAYMTGDGITVSAPKLGSTANIVNSYEANADSFAVDGTASDAGGNNNTVNRIGVRGDAFISSASTNTTAIGVFGTANHEGDADQAYAGRFEDANVYIEEAIVFNNNGAQPNLQTGIGGSIYARNNEVYVTDNAANETLISPHNESGEWQFFSRNTKTGRVMKINMEKFIRKMEEITGESFIEEWFE